MFLGASVDGTFQQLSSDSKSVLPSPVHVCGQVEAKKLGKDLERLAIA